MSYATLSQSELDELLAASTAPNSAVRIWTTDHALKITLAKVVAMSNFKALASLGRQGMASFDGSTKTLTIPLRDKAGFASGEKVYGEPVMSDAHGYVFCESWNGCAAILGMHYDQKDGLLKLVRRLAGGKVKTFSSPQAEAAARREASQKRRTAAPATIAREVWSDDEGDMVLVGEGWNR
ncbi:hypothetical protein [Burkholderia gladioli]|uniref:hypothetical protein n=1 Tax=Burkholderia gladioli TaxID=28095 RepID=UPI00163FAEF6|nr:hypothetical protein [Burkholderia gladioli]